MAYIKGRGEFVTMNSNCNTHKSCLLFAIMFFASIMCPLLNGQAAGSTIDKPRLWVLIEEKAIWILDTADISENPGQAEITLMEELGRLGYKVVDSATVRKNITQAKGLRTLEGDVHAAAAVGLQYGAQFSVVGKAISKLGKVELYGTKMKSIHATVNARIIRNADARIVASASANASVAHLDEVIGGAMAIERAARELAGKLNGSFQSLQTLNDSSETEIVLKISGLKSYRHLDSIMGFLENNAHGVEKVRLGNFTAGTAEVTIEYRGKLRDLAGYLARKKFTDFRLEPTHVTSNRIDLTTIFNTD